MKNKKSIVNVYRYIDFKTAGGVRDYLKEYFYISLVCDGGGGGPIIKS